MRLSLARLLNQIVRRGAAVKPSPVCGVPVGSISSRRVSSSATGWCCTPRTVRRWLTPFRDGGVEALAGAPIPGRPPKADAAYLAALETALDTPPRALRLPFDVWSSRHRSAYLEEQTGIRIAPGWLRVLLHRQRFACGRPKHTLAHLQDPDDVAACEAALQAAGEKGGGRAGAVRVAL
jgi:transposase